MPRQTLTALAAIFLAACSSEDGSGQPQTGGSSGAADASSEPEADANETQPDVANESGGSGGYGGAEMVWVPAADGTTYGIDRTEVTNADYLAWLATAPSTEGQPDYCAWNTDFDIKCGQPSGKLDHPVVCVDWCDAYAFCKSVGKRLCGKVGGGPLPFDEFAETQDQWYNACSSGGVYDYPYGYYYDPMACRGADAGLDVSVPVASMPGCQSDDPAFAGVFDLSGNAIEWIDSCKETAGEEDWCYVSGGSVSGGEDYLRCDSEGTVDRGVHSDELGFRCCSDP